MMKPPTRNRPNGIQQDEEDEELARRRLINREAAARARRKQKENYTELKQRVLALESEKTNLKYENYQLEKQVKKLKEVISNHIPNCPNPLDLQEMMTEPRPSAEDENDAGPDDNSEACSYVTEHQNTHFEAVTEQAPQDTNSHASTQILEPVLSEPSVSVIQTRSRRVMSAPVIDAMQGTNHEDYSQTVLKRSHKSMAGSVILSAPGRTLSQDDGTVAKRPALGHEYQAQKDDQTSGIAHTGFKVPKGTPYMHTASIDSEKAPFTTINLELLAESAVQQPESQGATEKVSPDKDHQVGQSANRYFARAKKSSELHSNIISEIKLSQNGTRPAHNTTAVNSMAPFSIAADLSPSYVTAGPLSGTTMTMHPIQSQFRTTPIQVIAPNNQQIHAQGNTEVGTSSNTYFQQPQEGSVATIAASNSSTGSNFLVVNNFSAASLGESQSNYAFSSHNSIKAAGMGTGSLDEQCVQVTLINEGSIANRVEVYDTPATIIQADTIHQRVTFEAPIPTVVEEKENRDHPPREVVVSQGNQIYYNL